MCLRPFGLYCSACLGILFVSILCMCCSHLLLIHSHNGNWNTYIIGTLIAVTKSLLHSASIDFSVFSSFVWEDSISPVNISYSALAQVVVTCCSAVKLKFYWLLNSPTIEFHSCSTPPSHSSGAKFRFLNTVSLLAVYTNPVSLYDATLVCMLITNAHRIHIR